MNPSEIRDRLWDLVSPEDLIAVDEKTGDELLGVVSLLQHSVRVPNSPTKPCCTLGTGQPQPWCGSLQQQLLGYATPSIRLARGGPGLCTVTITVRSCIVTY